MKNIIRTRSEISGLQYRNAYGCIELRLYLLSLLQDISKQYHQAEDKAQLYVLVKTFKELEKLYKSFTALTLNPSGNYKAQFEFAKSLITSKLDRICPEQKLSRVA